MPEKRKTEREQTIDNRIRTLAELGDGTVLEGMVADVSVDGVRVAGPTTGINAGDEIRLVLVFLTNEKVSYRCRIRHVDPNGKFFGAEFKSPPQRIE